MFAQIIRNMFVLVVALGVTLGGFGMVSAHEHVSQIGVSEVTNHNHDGHSDHTAHAGMLHGLQSGQSETIDPHEGHSDCTMIACCHVGAVFSVYPRTELDLTDVAFEALSGHQHSDAERDRADKPPKQA